MSCGSVWRETSRKMTYLVLLVPGAEAGQDQSISHSGGEVELLQQALGLIGVVVCRQVAVVVMAWWFCGEEEQEVGEVK